MRKSNGAAGDPHGAFQKLPFLSPFIQIGVEGVNRLLVFFPTFVPSPNEEDLPAESSHPCHAQASGQGSHEAPLVSRGVIALHWNDVDPLPAGAQLAAPQDIGPVGQRGSTVPTSRAAQPATVPPRIQGRVVAADGPGVSIVHIATGQQDLPVDDHAGMAAAWQLHVGFGLPAVGRRDVAFDRDQGAFCVAASDGVEVPIESTEAEVSPFVGHVSQV